MALIKEPVTPSLIENTEMVKGILNDVHKTYEITPCEGYVLHDKRLDNEVIDEITGEPTGEVILRYYEGTRTVPASYDFVANPWELYAVLRSSVPENDICDNTQPPEIMSVEEPTAND